MVKDKGDRGAERRDGKQNDDIRLMKTSDTGSGAGAGAGASSNSNSKPGWPIFPRTDTSEKKPVLVSPGMELGWCHLATHGWFEFDPKRAAVEQKRTWCPKCMAYQSKSERGANVASDSTKKATKSRWWEKGMGDYIWSDKPWPEED